MAKRMKSKIQPAVMKLNFEQRLISASTYNYLDLSQVASLVNRRFYRQGLNWAVSGIKIQQTAATAVGPSPGFPMITISKLPNTWVMSNAWEKGFRSWMDMNKDALEEAPSVKPKFLDFKIFMNDGHHDLGTVSNMLPVDSASNLAVAGEWESSKLRIPVGVAAPGDTTEREIIATGPSYPGNSAASGLNAVSLIEGYAASRGLPNVLDPNAPGDADDATGTTPQNWMSALKSEGTEQDQAVLADMISENNIAPYPFENDGTHTDTMYPGGANQLAGLEIHERAIVSDTIIGNTVYFNGGNFPCGLLQFHFDNYLATTEAPITAYVEVTLVPGDHRGYLAESMTEM